MIGSIVFNKNNIKMKNSKYLVRLRDSHIFEIDDYNNCYRSYTCKEVKMYGTNEQSHAQSHFTYENLTSNYNFIPIDESEIEYYANKNDEYHNFINWQHRSDGHGDIKGGTYEEYLDYKKRYAKQ